jgi:hypothetical protein
VQAEEVCREYLANVKSIWTDVLPIATVIAAILDPHLKSCTHILDKREVKQAWGIIQSEFKEFKQKVNTPLRKKRIHVKIVKKKRVEQTETSRWV